MSNIVFPAGAHSEGSSPTGMFDRDVRQQHAHRSNPQLNVMGATIPGRDQLLMAGQGSSSKQRHSTGNLAAEGQHMSNSCSPALPRKGILKRPHTFHLERQRASASPGGRRDRTAAAVSPPMAKSPPTTSEAGAQENGAAKASPHVEFAERNAVTVFGDTTDTECGADSVQQLQPQQQSLAAGKKSSSTAVVSPVIRQKAAAQEGAVAEPEPEEQTGSHIVGKWWFGKSTKFVVHCDRRGCSGHSRHSSSPTTMRSRESTPLVEEQPGQHADEDSSYLTPTQRRQKEMSALKKELRRTQLACREKERHLGQLRERLEEIELLMASSTSAQMVQCAQLRQQQLEREQEHQAQREALVARHEHKVRQLSQEIADLHAELAKKEKVLAERERIQRRDHGVQVGGGDQNQQTLSPPPPLSPSLVPATAVGWTPPVGANDVQHTDTPPFAEKSVAEERPDALKTSPLAQPAFLSKSAPVSPCKGPLAQAELVATLEAYRAETVVWRTRCAQLELILQDLLLREGTRRGELNAGIGVELKSEEIEAEGAVQEQQTLHEHQQQKAVEMAQRKITAPAIMQSTPKGECQRGDCVEKKRVWDEKQMQMVQKIGELEQALAELRTKNADVEHELEKTQSAMVLLKREHAELAELAERRLCEGKAVQMSLQEATARRDKLEQALAYLERRCSALEQHGLDMGMVLVEDRDEGPLSEGLFTFRTSKACQTLLTADAISCSERELGELHIQINAMKSAFSEDRAALGDQLKEIEFALALKTELVTTLTVQLEEAARRRRAEDEARQRERDAFTRRVEELGRTAERVPILESEMERALVESSRCKLRLRDAELRLDAKMEQALDEALHKGHLREEYWAERLDGVDRERRDLATRLQHERRLASDAQLRWEVHRADLDRRLQSAIEHVAALNAKLNCPRRDAQCDVRPRIANKYVACRPSQHDKAIGAELRDEEMHQMAEEARALAQEREWMSKELARLTLAAEKKQRKQTKDARKPLSSAFAVSFHRDGEGERVQLGSRFANSTTVDNDATLSSVSLPAVLEHRSDMKLDVRLREHSEQAQTCTSNGSTVENHGGLQQQREMSLPLGTSTLVRTVGEIAGRCRSAPRSEVTEEQTTILEIRIKEETQKQTQLVLLSEDVRHLREKMAELMEERVRGADAGMGRLEEFFAELEQWLRATADAELMRLEWQRRADRFRQERDCLDEQLKDALAELWVYRTEPRQEAWQRAIYGGKRSSSAEHLGHNGPPLSERQLRRWKEIAGTTFREVNQLRKRLTKADEERLAQRNQLAILRGELVMARCLGEERRAKSARGKRGSVGLDGETLDSYNRWLGGDQWQSVPDLDEVDQQQQRQLTKKRCSENAEIVHEAMKRQLMAMKEQIVHVEKRGQEELNRQKRVEEELRAELKSVGAECALLRRENAMYEEKCVDMERDRQQMYLVMFRKGQQAANMEKQETEEELDKAAELQVVLRFLHDAFFYYLLNKGNAREHLQAIMTMLNFTAEQKDQVYKRRGKSH